MINSTQVDGRYVGRINVAVAHFAGSVRQAVSGQTMMRVGAALDNDPVVIEAVDRALLDILGYREDMEGL